MTFRFLLLSIFCTLPNFAAQEYDTFYEELDVILYQLQVNVVDKKGNPIRGLTKEDFQIRISNKPQEIETIEEISLEDIIVQGDAFQAAAIPEQARRIFVLFFDLRYSKKGGVIAARNAAYEFVQTEMLPSDLIGIFTYNPLSGINMVTNFTTDQNHLLDALDTLGLSEMKNTVPGPSGYFLQGLLDDFTGGILDQQNRLTNASSQGGPGAASRGTQALALDNLLELAEKAAFAEKRNYETEVNSYLGSMKAFAEGLKYIRGRKNIMWFSSGFDSSGLVGEDLAQLSANAERAMYGDIDRVSTDQMGRGDIMNLANQTIKALQGSGSVVFAIDTSRLDGSANKKSGLQTLNFFSVDTGGRVYTNQNDILPIMEEIQTLTNHYYLVSFYPNAKAKPGKVQNLKVKVRAAGARVYANKGVLLESNFKKMSKLEKQIQLSEFVGRDQVTRAIPIDLATMQVPMNNKLVKLSVTADILGRYFLDTQEKSKPKKLELYTFAFTKKTNEIFDQTSFQFRIEPQKAKEILKENGVKYIADLFLAPGEYKLKVIARDMDTGKIGSAITDLNIKEPRPSISGPTLLDQGKWIMLREREEIQAQKKLGDLDFDYAYRFNGRDLVPATKNEVKHDQIASFFYTLDNLKGKEPKLGAALMGADNKPIQIPPAALKVDYDIPTKGTKPAKVLLSLDLSKLPLSPGNPYKMLTQIQVDGNKPIRSISDFTILSK